MRVKCKKRNYQWLISAFGFASIFYINKFHTVILTRVLWKVKQQNIWTKDMLWPLLYSTEQSVIPIMEQTHANRVSMQTPKLLCCYSASNHIWKMPQEASMENNETGKEDKFDHFMSKQSLSCLGQNVFCSFLLKENNVTPPPAPQMHTQWWVGRQ